jgi:hypothetical protein
MMIDRLWLLVDSLWALLRYFERDFMTGFHFMPTQKTDASTRMSVVTR